MRQECDAGRQQQDRGRAARNPTRPGHGALTPGERSHLLGPSGKGGAPASRAAQHCATAKKPRSDRDTQRITREIQQRDRSAVGIGNGPSGHGGNPAAA